VAHTRRGVEVISLRTGEAVVAMALTQGQTYADLDGDGLVDAVLVLETADDLSKASLYGDDASLQHFAVMVVSALPARSQLFNGSICEGRHNMQESLSRSARKPLLDISAASPVVLRAPN
jgi:hypothetical protein